MECWWFRTGRHGPATRGACYPFLYAVARPQHSKHGLQNPEQLNKRVFVQNAQSPNQLISIDSPELISNHMIVLMIKLASDAERIGITTRCQWRNDQRAELGIQLIWGDDNAGPRFPDF